MGFFRKLKEFAMRGNVIDLAVGVIIGGPSARSSPRWSTTSSCPHWQAYGQRQFGDLFISLDPEKTQAFPPWPRPAKRRRRHRLRLLSQHADRLPHRRFVHLPRHQGHKPAPGKDRPAAEADRRPRNARSVSPRFRARRSAAPTAPRRSNQGINHRDTEDTEKTRQRRRREEKVSENNADFFSLSLFLLCLCLLCVLCVSVVNPLLCGVLRLYP